VTEHHENKDKIGDDNTFVGDGPFPSTAGSRNTIVRPMDGSSDVIMNQGGLAIGSGASADSTSIAIGSGASAGDAAVLAHLLTELRASLDDPAAQNVLDDLRSEVDQGGADKIKIRRLWGTVKAAAVTNEAVGLVARITPLLLAVAHHL